FEHEYTVNESDQPSVTPVDGSSDIASLTDESDQRTETDAETATIYRVDCDTEACIDSVIAELDANKTPGQSDDESSTDLAVTALFTVTAASTELTTRTTRVSAFPLPGDRTPYTREKGDIYIQGDISGGLSLVAENDIVVTGNITQQNSSQQDGEFTSPD